MFFYYLTEPGRLNDNEKENLTLFLARGARPSHLREARMKDNKRVLVLLSLIILSSFLMSGETKKLREIGRYKFLSMPAGASTQEMMKAAVEKYADDIRRGFELAGSPELSAPFIDQVRQGAFTERQLAVGSPMLWMVFRSQGEIKIIRDLEWAGQEPLQVCSFSIQEGDKKYDIVVPKACGNIALEKVETVPAAEQPAPKQPPFEEKPEDRFQITKGKIYQEIADLINETDLYCSFFVWEKEMPGLQIIGAEREYEKTMFSDGDRVFLNKGKDGGIEPGQVFWVLEIYDNAPEYGRVAIGRGRARVLETFDTRSIAVVENTCDRVNIGNVLVPFETKEGMMGKDLGYEVPSVETGGAKGQVVYFQGLLNEIGSLMWALIDMGKDQGLQVGQQLIVYRKNRPDLPITIMGSCVVIDVRSKTATIKTLSVRDAVMKGDFVMERPR